MPSLKITVQVEVDGVPVSGFPLIRRLALDESQQFNYEKIADNDTVSFAALPASELSNIQALVLQVDQPITIRLDNQSDAGIELQAGGLLLILDAVIDAGAGVNNAKINNPHVTVSAQIKGVAAGT